MLPPALAPYEYVWPRPGSIGAPGWRGVRGGFVERRLPETLEQLARDSRWPGLFPSPICLVTTGDGTTAAMERVVGPSIVNRFPYIMALSLCVDDLSGRHYARSRFLDLLAESGQAAVQFLAPGPALDAALSAIAQLPDARAHERIRDCGLPVRAALSNGSPVFDEAYLVYEGRLLPRDPSMDIGSHRVFFVEINTIQLQADVAAGKRSILWRSLPAWKPQYGVMHLDEGRAVRQAELARLKFVKPYTSHYRFPAPSTVAFEATRHVRGMAVRDLPPDPTAQVEVDNERARWPCFFPSSVGIITASADGQHAVMPCGSTMVVSRHPMVIAPCISYSAINERYAPRATLDVIRRSRRFACGVPFISDDVMELITFTGNVSLKTDTHKLAQSGFRADTGGASPILLDLPVTFDCKVVGERRLGTHAMLLGEVERVLVREDVTDRNPMHWYPWAALSA